MARAKKNTRKDSLIPILFTLGVIGWGFFAIDRLTTEKNPESVLLNDKKTERNARASSKKNSSSNWKASVLKWLNDSLASTDNREALKNVSTQRSTQAGADASKDRLPIINEDMKLQPVNEEMSLTSLKLYFYEIKNGNNVVLKSVKRPVQKRPLLRTAKMAIELLVKGPIGSEQLRDFTDSFPNKPVLISINLKDSNLVLNFDEKFGQGISFQMLRYQISQLLFTAKQFPGIKSITILIRNKQIKHLGGDGLSIPPVINSSNWRT